jgi:hypothetical protein
VLPTTVRILTTPGIHYTLQEEFYLHLDRKSDVLYEYGSLTFSYYKDINVSTIVYLWKQQNEITLLTSLLTLNMISVIQAQTHITTATSDWMPLLQQINMDHTKDTSSKKNFTTTF